VEQLIVLIENLNGESLIEFNGWVDDGADYVTSFS
jgi:hypothetical protein